MQETNIIGDTAKKRRIDYNLIDKINRQYKTKARKEELEGKLSGKRKKKEEKEEPAPAPDRTYIQTPEELEYIQGEYSLQKGIYLINFEIIVPHGNTLILQPGVELYFTENAGMICRGEFEAKGKKDLEVLLTAKDKTEGWRDVYLGGTAKAIIDYTKIRYGRGRQNREGDINGGAIFVNSSKGIKPKLIVNNCIFENNSCQEHGGAIYNNKGNVTIGKDNRFENNLAGDSGGAIRNYEGRVIINENNIFKNNSAKYGAAIHILRGDVKIGKNNIFENNVAKWHGGSIRNLYGTLDIDKSKNTFIGNKPNDISYE